MYNINDNWFPLQREREKLSSAGEEGEMMLAPRRRLVILLGHLGGSSTSHKRSLSSAYVEIGGNSLFSGL